MIFVSHFSQAAIYTVNTLSDSGDGDCDVVECTLRDAINDAFDEAFGFPSQILFEPGLTGTIVLTSVLQPSTADLDIVGPGPEIITVSGNNLTSVFRLNRPRTSISGLTIADGNSSSSGAGIAVRGVGTLLENLRVINNVTTFLGGGISIGFGGSVIIRNCEISGNTASKGGGLQINGSSGDTALIENTTISDNTATSTATAIDVLTNTGQEVIFRYVTVANHSGTLSTATMDGDGVITIDASIFADNTSTRGDLFVGFQDPVFEINNSLVETTPSMLVGSNNIIGQDPFLSPLDFFNGSVLKVHALENGMSSAIDLIDNMVGDSQCGTGVIVDQLGFTRPSGLSCDAGAFEAASTPSAPPILDSIGEQNINELSTLEFTVSASDIDTAPENLTYVLMNQPAGATITTAGLFSFIPTEAQGPDSFTFDVVVTDDGIPINMDSETITVNVAEVNQNPILSFISQKFVTELQTLTFSAFASDNDLPSQNLTFSLLNQPANASISPSGQFSFTPTEIQGPDSFTFNVIVTDNGPGNLTDSQSVTVVVEEDNENPILDFIGNKTIADLETLSFTATASDVDLPIQDLFYSLQNQPPGATISSSGDFSFTPDASQIPGEFVFTVIVADDGPGFLRDLETITVTVDTIFIFNNGFESL
jgi:CSLREA domain-containing protein